MPEKKSSFESTQLKHFRGSISPFFIPGDLFLCIENPTRFFCCRLECLSLYFFVLHFTPSVILLGFTCTQTINTRMSSNIYKCQGNFDKFPKWYTTSARAKWIVKKKNKLKIYTSKIHSRCQQFTFAVFLFHSQLTVNISGWDWKCLCPLPRQYVCTIAKATSENQQELHIKLQLASLLLLLLCLLPLLKLNWEKRNTFIWRIAAAKKWTQNNRMKLKLHWTILWMVNEMEMQYQHWIRSHAPLSRYNCSAHGKGR